MTNPKIVLIFNFAEKTLFFLNLINITYLEKKKTTNNPCIGTNLGSDSFYWYG
jgi:hypothetical protein